MIGIPMPIHRGFAPTALAMIGLALACAGCATPTNQAPAKPATDATPGATLPKPHAPTAANAVPKTAAPGKGGQELERAVRSYEDGAYKNAAKQFQAALDLGLDSRSDQARAHKYLAFITCVSGREKSCRDEFRKAIDADPSFDLAASEIGHPVWGAAFRSVKADAAKAKSK
jgi:Tfp pilus assembly protein PilF